MARTIHLIANDCRPGIVTELPNRGTAGGSFLSTGTGATRPVIYKEFFNGINNGLSFDGTQQFLPTTITIANTISAAAWAIFCVAYIGSITFDAASPVDNEAILQGLNGGIFGMSLSSDPMLMTTNFDGAQKKAEVATVLRTPVLLQSRLSGGNLYARSGSAAESAGTASGNTAAGLTLRLGRNYNNSYAMIVLAELTVHNTNLSAAEILAERTYLSKKYAVAA